MNRGSLHLYRRERRAFCAKRRWSFTPNAHPANNQFWLRNCANVCFDRNITLLMAKERVEEKVCTRRNAATQEQSGGLVCEAVTYLGRACSTRF